MSSRHNTTVEEFLMQGGPYDPRAHPLFYTYWQTTPFSTDKIQQAISTVFYGIKVKVWEPGRWINVALLDFGATTAYERVGLTILIRNFIERGGLAPLYIIFGSAFCFPEEKEPTLFEYCLEEELYRARDFFVQKHNSSLQGNHKKRRQAKYYSQWIERCNRVLKRRFNLVTEIPNLKEKNMSSKSTIIFEARNANATGTRPAKYRLVIDGTEPGVFEQAGTDRMGEVAWGIAQSCPVTIPHVLELALHNVLQMQIKPSSLLNTVNLGLIQT
jgi:hypothetical protein